MAAAPQGLISFPGVRSVLHGSMPRAHGTTPCVATIYIAPQPVNQIAEVGTLTFRYGSTVINWHDARVDFMQSDVGNDGRKVWSLAIMDRRWKWKGTGATNGFFNGKIAPGSEESISGLERNPRELAKQCLEDMGEKTVFGLNNLPTSARPEVEWDFDKPAECLNAILEQFNCRVALDLRGRVQIVKLGQGGSLPSGGDVLSIGEVLNPPERPDKIAVVAARTLVQADLKLIAVGIDTDGKLKPINQLSYKPQGGWQNLDVHRFNNVSNPTAKDNAKATVFRWYQIETPFTVQLGPQAPAERIVTLNQILPLHNEQLEKGQYGGNANSRPYPSVVYGLFYEQKENDRNNRQRVEPPAPGVFGGANGRGAGVYDGSFSIDANKGIVKFSAPIFRHIPATRAQGQQVIAADLRLRIAFPLRDPKDARFHRYTRERSTRGRKFGTPTRFDKHEEIGLQVVLKYDRNMQIRDAVTNQNKVKQFADYYLDGIESEYRTLNPVSKQYAGFKAIELDGMIRQVVFVVEERGAAITQAAQDNEELHRVAPYQFQREVEALQNLKDAPKTPPSKRHAMGGAGPVRADQGAAFTASLSGSGSASFTPSGGGTASFAPGG